MVPFGRGGGFDCGQNRGLRGGVAGDDLQRIRAGRADHDRAEQPSLFTARPRLFRGRFAVPYTAWIYTTLAVPP